MILLTTCMALLKGRREIEVTMPATVVGDRAWISDTNGGAPLCASVSTRIDNDGIVFMKREVSRAVKRSTAWLVIGHKGKVVASGPVVFPEMTQ